ncbi:MAG: hypothetical protein KDA85_13055, partial [Planctomycetaceae bacterium]|nr:hypothetical protein [Planctomycetaceae bacterium]
DDFNLIRAFKSLPGRLCDVDITPTGSLFIACSSDALTGAARIYNTDDPAKTVDLPGLTSPVYAVSFRHDEKQVAVAGFDGQIRLFNAESGMLESEFPAVPLTPAAEAATASR